MNGSSLDGRAAQLPSPLGQTVLKHLGMEPWDGSMRIFVVELVKRSWLQGEEGRVDPPIGGAYRSRFMAGPTKGSRMIQLWVPRWEPTDD